MLTTADGTSDPYNRRDFERLLTGAEHDMFREHRLSDSPEAADIILFVGSTYPDHRDVRAHPLHRRLKEKCFLFHSDDHVIPFLPGVYVNITKRWYSPHRTVPGFYLQQYDVGYVPLTSPTASPDYLYCFVGSVRTHRIRTHVMSLKHPRAYLEDTSAASAAGQNNPYFMVTYDDANRRHYGQILAKSRFVLCPRGYACSTWRLFEAMKAGRVPVIISDQWVPPPGPAWDRFSLRVKERDVAHIPALLERAEPRAAAMGELARRTWERWFAPESCFHRVIEWCLALKRCRADAGVADVLPYVQLLRPFFLRHVLLPDIKKAGLNRLDDLRRVLPH
jgi:hypothetical protein